MKISYKKLMGIMLMLTIVVNSISYAKVRAVRARRDFEQTLSQSGMVVALFYEDQKSRGDERDKIIGLTRMYEDLSSYQPYNDADVIFLKVNVRRKDLADLGALYGVTSIPSFVFFSKGKQLLDDQGLPLSLDGFVSRADLQKSVDAYYGGQIKARVVAKEDRRNKILAEENESWRPYFYPRDMVVRGYGPEETQENME